LYLRYASPLLRYVPATGYRAVAPPHSGGLTGPVMLPSA
jgi:hypothetical protein